MDIQDEAAKKMRGFWERPEGVTGRLAIVAGIVASGVGLYYLEPYLIKLMENTLYMGALGAGIFVLSAPLWSSNVRTLTRYIFQSSMRAITGFFVQLDPIGIVESYVAELKKSLRKMTQQMSGLQGTITEMKQTIMEQAAEAQQELRKAGVAKQQQDLARVANLSARQASRLKHSNEELQAMVTKMENLYRILKKLYEVSDTSIQDMENDVKIKKRQRKAMKSGYAAFKSALKVLNGDPTGKALYDQAMEQMSADYTAKLGEIESFMEMSEGLIASIDLDNLMLEQEALEALEKKADAFFATPGAVPALSAENSSVAVPVQQSEVASLFAAFKS